MPTRKLFFYRIDGGANEAGAPRAFDAAPVIVHLATFPAQSRYATWFDETLVLVVSPGAS